MLNQEYLDHAILFYLDAGHIQGEKHMVLTMSADELSTKNSNLSNLTDILLPHLIGPQRL